MKGSTNLTAATVSGTLWNYAAFIGSKGLVFASTIILARILAPDDFGLLALGLIAINYLETVSDFGLGSALIYRQDGGERATQVAFGLNLAAGLLLTALAFFGAPFVAAFFDEPRVLPVVRVLAFGFLISSLSNIHQAQVKKRLDFRQRFVAEMGKAVSKGGLSIALALAGFGVWSLVWGQLAGWLASTLMYWWLGRWRPRIVVDWNLSRSLLAYGWQIGLVGLLGMVHNNVDYLIIGHRLDAGQLGFYTMAFRLPELVIVNICYTVGQALFPAYARLQNDPPRLRRGFLTTLRYVSLLTMPAGVGMYVVAPDFVRVVYSERWAPAGLVMQVLALYAVVYALSFNAGDVYKATGRPGLLNQIGLLKIALTVPVLWLAAGYGIFYVAVGQLATVVLLTLLRLTIASRILSMRPSVLLGAVQPAALGTAVMFVGTIVLRAQIGGLSPLLRLAILAASGALLYGITLWFASRELFHQSRSWLEAVIGPLPIAAGKLRRASR